MPTTKTGTEPAARAGRAEAAAKPPADPSRLIDTIQSAEESSIDAVRRFVDSVDQAFPDAVDEASRHQIIDAGFNMVEQLVRASNDLARDVVTTSQRLVRESGGSW